MAIKVKALKELYAKSAGRCAMCPNYESVFSGKIFGIDLQNSNFSEMAHIIARKKRGPRGKVGYVGDIDDYDNLIVLCSNHHTLIDNNPDQFPEAWIKQKKLALEQWVDSFAPSDSRRESDVYSIGAFIKHVPFIRIRAFCEDLPERFDSRFLDVGTILEAFPVDLPHARPFFDVELELRFSLFESSYEDLTNLLTSRFEVKGCSVSTYRQAYQVGSRNIVPLNKGELYASAESFGIQSAIRDAHHAFLKSYLDLISYLRSHYLEVDLDSYQPYSF